MSTVHDDKRPKPKNAKLNKKKRSPVLSLSAKTKRVRNMQGVIASGYNERTYKNVKERGRKGASKQKGEKAKKGKGLDENGRNCGSSQDEDKNKSEGPCHSGYSG